MTFSCEILNQCQQAKGAFYALCENEEGNGFRIVMANGHAQRSGDLLTYPQVNETLMKCKVFEELQYSDQNGWYFPPQNSM